MPGIGIADLLDAIESKVATTGRFETVNTHEPKHAPGPRHTAIWVQTIDPLPGASGLAATAGRIEFTQRLYSSMMAEPQDEIDPGIVENVDALMEMYSGDFDIGQRVRNVDLLGAHGRPLSAEAGYLELGQGKIFRVVDIHLPLIVNDLWQQEA